MVLPSNRSRVIAHKTLLDVPPVATVQCLFARWSWTILQILASVTCLILSWTGHVHATPAATLVPLTRETSSRLRVTFRSRLTYLLDFVATVLQSSGMTFTSSFTELAHDLIWYQILNLGCTRFSIASIRCISKSFQPYYYYMEATRSLGP